MDGTIFVGQNTDGDARGLNFPFYTSPYAAGESSSLETSWSHPPGDGQYRSRRDLRTLSGEGWTDPADIRQYASLDDGFNSEFGLDINPADSALFARGRTMEPSVDGSTPLDTTEFVSTDQHFGDGSSPDSSKIGATTPSRLMTALDTSARQTTSMSSPTSGDSAGTADVKHHRERNRVAARKCRQKAKKNFAGLQQREKELSQRNKVLRSHVGGLRDQILDLKNEILRHSACDNSVIQDYIAKAARRQST
ncbi:hypothetical protein F5Y01DRAFT_3092 [Xylaria sp. FL0043]|nr:hypothetical protein F5Y01DRAFT_3092 [Xylaria sp. FL0043]